MNLQSLPHFVSVADMQELNLGEEFIKLVCQELVPMVIYKHNPVFAKEEIVELIRKKPKAKAKSISFVMNEDDRNKLGPQFSKVSGEMIEKILEETTRKNFRPIKCHIEAKDIPLSFQTYYYEHAGGMSRNALLTAMTTFYVRRTPKDGFLF